MGTLETELQQFRRGSFAAVRVLELDYENKRV